MSSGGFTIALEGRSHFMGCNEGFRLCGLLSNSGSLCFYPILCGLIGGVIVDLRGPRNEPIRVLLEAAWALGVIADNQLWEDIK